MKSFSLRTSKRTEFLNIDDQVQREFTAAGLQSGMVQVFVPHTTAGVTINENADPDVKADMALILDRMVPWEAGYAHAEGNSAAHVKASMIGPAPPFSWKTAACNLAPGNPSIFANSTGPAPARSG